MWSFNPKEKDDVPKANHRSDKVDSSSFVIVMQVRIETAFTESESLCQEIKAINEVFW